MTDGRFYDIVHPEAVFVLKSRAIVGLRPDPETGVPDRSEDIALLHIVRTSEVPAVGWNPPLLLPTDDRKAAQEGKPCDPC